MQKNHSFKDLTTLKVGGPIHCLVECKTEEELIRKLAEESGQFFILGGGSNVLAPDGTYPGTVYMPHLEQVLFEDCGDTTVVTIGAGVIWDTLVKETVSKGLWGFENLSGIPGTLGGAVFQNIGAYGEVLSNTCTQVRAFDMNTKQIKEFSRDECLYGYRTSVFKKNAPRYVILSAQFTLTKHGAPNITYRDLASGFANDPSPRLSALRSAVLQIRKKKFPDLNEYGTAGSFFLNPVVGEEEASQFTALYPDMPVFPLPEGGVKIPLAWILDNVIGAKQFYEGGAFVWKEQALVIATKENVTAHDVHTLAKKIQKEVFEKTKIKIIPEVYIL